MIADGISSAIHTLYTKSWLLDSSYHLTLSLPLSNSLEYSWWIWKWEAKKKPHKFYLCLSFLFFTFQNGSVSWKLFSCWENILFFYSVSLFFICFEPFSHKFTSTALTVQSCFCSHRPGIVQLQKVTVDFSQNLNPSDRAFNSSCLFGISDLTHPSALQDVDILWRS